MSFDVEAAVQQLLSVFENAGDDVLDDQVLDVSRGLAMEEINDEDSADVQEAMVTAAEHRASEVNNLGLEGQLRWLFEQGLSVEDILCGR